MTESPNAPVALELTPDDVEGFPSRLRDKIEATGGARGGPRRWILIGAESGGEAAAIHRTAAIAGRIAARRRGELAERHIQALVDVYLEGEERADIDRELEQDNAELRARYLQDVPTYTAADIHELMHGAQRSNPSEPASRWRREKRVFAVRVGRVRLFPQFQFSDGGPCPVIKDVLKRLPNGMSSWQIAFWFRSGNGWLDGASPEERLADENAVLDAADRLREPAIG